jgi:tungstate transport system permease protein
MIIAQTIISFPLVAGFTMAAVMGVDPNLRQQVISLGATSRQAVWAVLMEAKVGVMVSIIAGFGGIISEVGAVMLVGGNIEGKTRVLTTAIVLETRKGNFDLALALGGVLLLMSFIANVAMFRLQGKAFDELVEKRCTASKIFESVMKVVAFCNWMNWRFIVERY